MNLKQMMAVVVVVMLTVSSVPFAGAITGDNTGVARADVGSDGCADDVAGMLVGMPVTMFSNYMDPCWSSYDSGDNLTDTERYTSAQSYKQLYDSSVDATEYERTNAKQILLSAGQTELAKQMDSGASKSVAITEARTKIRDRAAEMQLTHIYTERELFAALSADMTSAAADDSTKVRYGVYEPRGYDGEWDLTAQVPQDSGGEDYILETNKTVDRVDVVKEQFELANSTETQRPTGFEITYEDGSTQVVDVNRSTDTDASQSQTHNIRVTSKNGDEIWVYQGSASADVMQTVSQANSDALDAVGTTEEGYYSTVFEEYKDGNINASDLLSWRELAAQSMSSNDIGTGYYQALRYRQMGLGGTGLEYSVTADLHNQSEIGSRTLESNETRNVDIYTKTPPDTEYNNSSAWLNNTTYRTADFESPIYFVYSGDDSVRANEFSGNFTIREIKNTDTGNTTDHAMFVDRDVDPSEPGEFEDSINNQKNETDRVENRSESNDGIGGIIAPGSGDGGDVPWGDLTGLGLVSVLIFGSGFLMIALALLLGVGRTYLPG
jgi:hypothetical protein